jgi:hypothetical protein
MNITKAASGDTSGTQPQIEQQDSTIDSRVQLTLLQLLFDQLPKGLVATAINASLLSYITSGVIKGPVPKVWLGAMLVVCVCRAVSFVNFRRYGQSSKDYKRWRSGFAVGAITTGALWGLSGIVLFSTESYQHQAFIGFILAGMAAGAAGSMAAHDKIFRTYLFLAIAPYVVRLGQMSIWQWPQWALRSSPLWA